MGDEAILLKIKRQFAQDESIKALLKIISDLEFEVGVLKSEKEELKFELDNLRSSIELDGVKTKKAWAKDDLFKLMVMEQRRTEDNCKKARKALDEWRYKYFNLLAKLNPLPASQETDTTKIS